MTAFTLGLNQKFNSKEDVESKLTDLKPGVTVASFGGNSYGVGACEAIAEKLAQIETLEIANLDDMFTGRLREEIPRSMDALLTALLHCPNLHTVNLSDNAFGIATVAPLEQFLAEHTPLQHLILANNGFGPEAGAKVGLALEKLAAKKKAANHPAKLETVICGRNRLENGSMQAWSRFIKAHGSIKDLRLYQNGIRQEGIELLMLEGLKYAPELQTLDLQDNTFTELGSSAMAGVLPSWPAIKKISVSDCLLSAKGGELVAAALRSESLAGLEYLHLQYNEIDETGLKIIADAVEHNLKNLKLLELNGNRFSEEHEHVDYIQRIFEQRGFGELDELDDMEEETDESEEESDAQDEELESASRDAEYAEAEPVPAENDKNVDELAAKLEKTSI